VNSGASQEGI